MRAVAILALLAGCGKKTAPEHPTPAPAPAPAAPAPAPAPAPTVESEAQRPPATESEAQRAPQDRPHNADFMVAVQYADGSSAKGHVVRVERSEDWFGEDDNWTDQAAKLNVSLEADGTEKDVPWSDLRSVVVQYGGKEDISCDMNSEFTPAMYQCTLKTQTKVVTADGKTWSASDRHKWRLITATGDVLEFWIFKLPARKQEEAVPDVGTTTENVQIYTSLQEELVKEKAGKVPTSITVTTP